MDPKGEEAVGAQRTVRFIVLAGLLVMPVPAWSQSGTTGAIAGMVKDTTGAVLPGVTVEAASPALIEKVRTVVSDDKANTRLSTSGPAYRHIQFGWLWHRQA